MNFGTLGTGFGALGRGGGGTFDANAAPYAESLYGSGELGDFWEVADSTRLFQLSDGTTAAAVDSPVGYVGGYRGNHNFTQSTAGLRPLLKGSAGTRRLQFDDTNDTMTVASSTALFNWLHNGAGGSMWVLGASAAGEDKFFISSKFNTTPTTIGVIITRQNSTSRPRYLISNGTSSVHVLEPASGAPWPADTPALITGTYITGANGGKLYLNDTMLVQASESNAPSSSDATSDLSLASVATLAPNDVRAFGVINRVLTPTEIANLHADYSARGYLDPA